MLDSWHGTIDARGVSDDRRVLLVLRDIEVNADEDSLAFHVDILDRDPGGEGDERGMSGANGLGLARE
eukprot:scaffold51165_cov32-Tisochrysis_lutea.AAC.1